MNLPDYNFLAAPLWLITVLHWVTLTLHFVAMNFVVGGIIVVLFGRLEDRWNNPVVRRFIKLFPSIMAATVTLGVAPLLFLQLTYYHQAYSAAIISAWFWLAIVAAVIFSYYFLYGASFAKNPTPKRLGWYLSLALVGLLYVAWIYSSVFTMAERPAAMTTLYANNQSGFVINPAIGSYVLRWLHMLLGAVTVGGFFAGLLGRDHEPVFKLGRTWFLYGMIATMVLGLVYLFTLGEILLPLMRSSGIWVLTAAIVLSLGALHFFFRKKFVMSGVLTLLSMLGMVVTRHVVRQLYLDPTWNPASIPVNPQWSVLALFLICFVLAVGLVWYMLRIFFGENRQAA